MIALTLQGEAVNDSRRTAIRVDASVTIPVISTDCGGLRMMVQSMAFSARWSLREILECSGRCVLP